MGDFSMKSSDSEDYDDSDDELRDAFAKGLLKPGLNVVEEEDDEESELVNDTVKMKQKLNKLLLKAPWIERMDITNDLAPLAPELAIQLEKHEQKRANVFKGNKKIRYIAPDSDPVINDFKREIIFHRQAQAAVLEGMKKLHQLGLTTKRPDDYFAEMAKTDEHMQKVRQNLLAKQEGIAKSERVRQLREQRRIGTLIQRQTTEKRDEERRKTLSNIKQFRKGKLSSLDFLDDDKERSGGSKRQRGTVKKVVSGKRKARDAKFGFGGKKRGSKRNTKESFMSDGPKFNKNGAGGGKRLGKSRRHQNKNKK